jgi:hypothetical protein
VITWAEVYDKQPEREGGREGGSDAIIKVVNLFTYTYLR